MSAKEMTFDEIMAYDSSNGNVYEDMLKHCKKGALIPFVGAGLSVSAGFETWRDFLKRMYSKHSEYFGGATVAPDNPFVAAAGFYIAIRDAEFHNEVKEAFGDKYSEEKWRDIADRVKGEAVGILPGLFKGAVVTTNFDSLLEHVYPAGTPVSHPGHYEEINKAIQTGKGLSVRM